MSMCTNTTPTVPTLRVTNRTVKFRGLDCGKRRGEGGSMEEVGGEMMRMLTIPSLPTQWRCNMRFYDKWVLKGWWFDSGCFSRQMRNLKRWGTTSG